MGEEILTTSAIATLKAFTKQVYAAASDGRKVWMEICPCGIALRAKADGRRYVRLITWDRIEDAPLIERMAEQEIGALVRNLQRMSNEAATLSRIALAAGRSSS